MTIGTTVPPSAADDGREWRDLGIDRAVISDESTRTIGTLAHLGGFAAGAGTVLLFPNIRASVRAARKA